SDTFATRATHSAWSNGLGAGRGSGCRGRQVAHIQWTGSRSIVCVTTGTGGGAGGRRAGGGGAGGGGGPAVCFSARARGAGGRRGGRGRGRAGLDVAFLHLLGDELVGRGAGLGLAGELLGLRLAGSPLTAELDGELLAVHLDGPELIGTALAEVEFAPAHGFLAVVTPGPERLPRRP